LTSVLSHSRIPRSLTGGRWPSIGKRDAGRTIPLAARKRIALTEPLVFIGSSSEGEDYAHGVKEVLEENGMICARHWRDVMAEAQSQTGIEALVDALDEYDFGIFILSKDDALTIRGETTSAPRDNVVLELGLFTGRLGREHTFIIGPADFDYRIATDLLGINLGTYTSDPNKTSAVRTTARRARERILKIGPRFLESRADSTPATAGLEHEPALRGRNRDAPVREHASPNPPAPSDGWAEAAREGLLVSLAGVKIEPGMWIASPQTGLGQVLEVLPPIRDSVMLISVAVEGLDRALYLNEHRLFLPQFESASNRP